VSERDAFDFTRDQAKATISHSWHRLIDHGRRLVTAKLLAILGGAFGFVVAAQFFLPALVAAGCAVGLVLLAAWAVQTQRLLHREREAGRWRSIDILRARQRELRAQAALREATLVVAELRGGGNAQMRTYQPLVEAVRYSRGRARAVMKADASPRQRQQADAAPKAPAVGPVERELKDLREQDEVVEAQIQALAAPDTKWEARANEKGEEYRRAKKADLEARKRARNGQRPTAPSPGLAFAIGRNPDGSRRVANRKPDPTPEQIARGERPDEDEHQAA
jgi:hypothetical protein